MARLSVIIPSRDERFLIPTIRDIFKNATQEIEIVAVLDSDKWPEGWKEITDQYPNLHTIHNGHSIGMRGSINKGVASAISRGAKFIMKSDGHCSFSEGFDEILKAECEPNWVVVPRRGRLDPENWVATETHKPDIDYHYLSFPDDPQDFGGPGLNGKPWLERAVERKDILLDDEMSSQGSCWFMQADYFNQLELMDESSYGPFWNEFQEIGLKCWLSGGQVKINKKAKYLHLHKGRTYGRGYHLPESWLQQGRTHANLWAFNEAWPKQTLPFSWLIKHFWPVPTWPDNWEEILYATRMPREIGGRVSVAVGVSDGYDGAVGDDDLPMAEGLRIHSAVYGVSGDLHGQSIGVAGRVRELIKDNSLDIIVNNSTLTPGDNPFRGKKKRLLVRYSIDGGEVVEVARDEKDWLIIGPMGQRVDGLRVEKVNSTDDELHRDGDQGTVVGENEFGSLVQWDDGVPAGRMPKDKIQPLNGIYQKQGNQLKEVVRFTGGGENISSPIPFSQPLPQATITVRRLDSPPTTAAALNDYLIRRFSISPQRLRGPMPIELRDFHRNDLAQLFAELGFKRGAEIGVAEGNYSEVLLKANPECELLLIDPWHAYSDNPQNKTKEKHEFAYNEVLRKTRLYPNVKIDMRLSMDAVRDIADGYLDWAYLDAMHSFNFVMMDIICWSKKVRSGGLLVLDDFYFIDRARWGAGVVEAVQAFTSAHQIHPWFTCSGHKSVEAFWVNP